MTAPPQVPLGQVVDELRQVPTGAERAPTVSQVQLLIEDIWAMRHVRISQARPELSMFTVDELIVIAELFGKHRARVRRGGKLTGRRNRHEAEATGMLLPPSEEEMRRARELINTPTEGMTPGQRKAHKAARKAVEHAIALAESDLGVLPAGYDQYECGRDVATSVDAILAEPVNEAEIIRFVDRTYTIPVLQVTADHVLLLHWLASNGLGYKLLDAAGKAAVVKGGRTRVVTTGSANPALSKVMVDAFDLLDVTRKDALRGLAAVVRKEATTPTEVRTALTASNWLAPGEIGRVLQVCDRAVADPGNVALARVFTSQVGYLVQAVHSAPERFIVRDVEHLTLAHVSQILTLSGLSVDGGEEKVAARELRSQLVSMGLLHDLDRELPEALRAWRTGRLEEFFTSRQARLDGDPEWARAYALEEATAAVC